MRIEDLIRLRSSLKTVIGCHRFKKLLHHLFAVSRRLPVKIKLTLEHFNCLAPDLLFSPKYGLHTFYAVKLLPDSIVDPPLD